MKRAGKEELERIYIEAFANAYPAFPSGRMDKSENPDFLVHNGEDVLGIELTRIFRKSRHELSPMREQESLRERIADIAKSEYDERDLPPVHVSVFFDDQHILRKADVRRIAEKLVALVVRLMPEPGYSCEEEYDWINREYFPEEVLHVIVRRREYMTASFWSTPLAAFLPQVGPEEIQAEIAKKEQKLDLYLRSCARAWLVLLSHGEGLSSIIAVSSEALSAKYLTRFERVFLFQMPASVNELATLTK
jgi:hypothetical protein